MTFSRTSCRPTAYVCAAEGMHHRSVLVCFIPQAFEQANEHKTSALVRPPDSTEGAPPAPLVAWPWFARLAADLLQNGEPRHRLFRSRTKDTE